MARLEGAGYSVEFDATVRDQTQKANRITDHPVEDKENVADHIKPEPEELDLEIYISGEQAMDKYEELAEMREEEEVFTYYGNFEVHEDMAIHEITALKEAQFGNGFECQLRLKQVRFASIETVDIELGQDPETGDEIEGEEGAPEEKDTGEDDVDDDTADPTSLRLIEQYLRGEDEEEEDEEEENGEGD